MSLPDTNLAGGAEGTLRIEITNQRRRRGGAGKRLLRTARRMRRTPGDDELYNQMQHAAQAMPVQERPAKKAKSLRITKAAVLVRQRNHTEIIYALSCPLCVP